MIALAMATLCFCPPEIWPPFTPTPLLNPYPSPVSMKEIALALVAAILMSSMVASALLYFMFSEKDVLNKAGS